MTNALSVLDTPQAVPCPLCKVSAGEPCIWKTKWARAGEKYQWHQQRKNRLADTRRRERAHANKVALRATQERVAAAKRAAEAQARVDRARRNLNELRAHGLMMAHRRAASRERQQQAAQRRLDREALLASRRQLLRDPDAAGKGWRSRAQHEYARIALAESYERQNAFYERRAQRMSGANPIVMPADTPEPCWKCGAARVTHFTPCCA